MSRWYEFLLGLGLCYPNLSIRNESPLIGEDNFWEKVLKPGGGNFGKDFLRGIIEGDGMMLVEIVCVFDLGDQRQEEGICGSPYLAI